MSLNTSTKKLLTYSALSAAFMAVSADADAQALYYNDFDPDEEVDGRLPIGYDELFMDVNADGINDFRLWAEDTETAGLSAGWRKVGIEALGGNQVAEELTTYDCGGYGYSRDIVRPLSIGSSVEPLMNWAGGSRSVSSNTWNSDYGYYCEPFWGNFTNFAEQFIGIRFQDGLDWNYGWIRVKRAGLARMMVLDHALNVIPNQPLLIDGAPLANCDTPTGLNVNFITPTKATLSWTPVTDAEKYLITGTKVGTGVNYSKITLNNFLTANGLGASSTYEWQVRAQCIGGTISPESVLNSFTTPSPFGSGGDAATSAADVALRVSSVDKQLNVHVESLQAGEVEMEMLNTAGVVIDQWSRNVEAGFSTVQLDCKDVPAGLYIISVRQNGLIESAKVFVD